jgi:uncharacterized protein (TIGR02246 family)
VNDDDRALLELLARRVQVLEDERAIHNTLTRYGFGVDSDDPEGTANLYAEDCVIDIDNVSFMHGRDEVNAMVKGELHQAILPNCAHLMGPFAIEVEDDRAVATGYATVYVRSDGETRVWRQAFGRWQLERRDDRWQIVRRTSRAVGTVDAQRLINEGL